MYPRPAFGEHFRQPDSVFSRSSRSCVVPGWRDDGCLYAIDRTFIVRPQRESLELLGSQQPLIGVPTLNSRGVGTLAVVTVIDDGSNWYARNEVRQTA